MLEKLKELALRYEDLQAQLADPSVYGDAERLKTVNRELKDLTPVAEAYQAYRQAEADRAAAEELLSDPEMRELAQEELTAAREEMERLRQELKLLLLPKDPNDRKNVILEIRAGTGGEEAALFAASLLRMYTMYAAARGWRTDTVELNETELGGVKECSVLIEGEGAWSRLKFESGVHRVQRVPVTESNGRIQTSAATVAVLPEAEEVDVVLNPADIRKDTYCSSGPGGQSVNTTYSAVRITHIPSGISVQCQNERSQHHNKDSAMRILRGRLYDLELSKRDAARQAEYAGKNAISFGSQIRTYTLQPYRLVKDHRNNCEIGDTDAVLDGRIDKLLRDYLLWQHTNRQQQQQ